ncbi:MAG: triose-phosphate isomerase [Nitrospirota bacterium]
MRTPCIVANWKMHKTVGETNDFLAGFIPLVRDVADVDMVIAPPFTALVPAAAGIEGTNIILAAQNVFYEEKGAYTGEISPRMLLDIGCRYCIIGHSERRQYFHETDETVNRKVRISTQTGLGVILCIGESLEAREAEKTFAILSRQLEIGLRGIEYTGKIIVAYEPVWAIGTGKTATPEQAQEAHAFIRERLRIFYGNNAEKLGILYGGSVTPENVDSLMACRDVDGALVGGASLKAESFSRIVKFRKVQ